MDIPSAYPFVFGAFRSTRVAMRRAGVVSYLHADHLGSASLTTDAGGNRFSEERYYPFGETRLGSSPTDYQFMGQREESGLGSLYDFQARMYSPYLNRWLQPDSIVPQPGNPQSLNRYSYVRNNPLRYTDPTGHRECEDEDCLRPPPQQRSNRHTSDPLTSYLQQSQPRPDWIDLAFDRATLFMDGVATIGTLVGAGAEIGGCMAGGPPGCGTGFELYNEFINGPESALGTFSMVATIAADFKRHNSRLDLLHLSVTVGADSHLAVTSWAIGLIDAEPASDTLINLNSFMNDINNYNVDLAAVEGRVIEPRLPVLKLNQPTEFHLLNYMFGPFAHQFVYTILEGKK